MKFIRGANINMKNDAYRCSKMKYQLSERKRKGIKYVDWKLNCQQIEFVKGLGYEIKVVLYEITTRTFKQIRNLDPILKCIHYKNKKGSKTTVLKLTENQIKILADYGVKCRPYKYRIFLSD